MSGIGNPDMSADIAGENSSSAAATTQAAGLPFWVEVLDKHHAVASRQRAHGSRMTVGRAYDNDLIVDDPFVAPLHLSIGYDSNGELWIDDLAGGGAAPGSTPTRLLVASEASIRIGHTLLRVRSARFQVPPALSMAGQRDTSRLASYGIKALGVAAAFIAVSLLSTWLAQTTEFKLASYLPAALYFPLFVVGWSGGWALVTQIMTSRAQFSRHLFIAFTFLLAVFVIDLATDFLAYSFTLTAPQRWLPIALWAIAGVLFFAHIAVIIPRHRRVIGATVAIVVVLAIGVHISLRLESDRVQPQQIAARLMPTFLLAKSAGTPDNFFKDVDALRPKLEEASKKDPTESGPSFDDYD